MHDYLRYAANGDIKLIFDWANDPDVRKSAFSTGKISYEEHVIWYDRAMRSADTVMYIYSADKTDIGQIRIDINGDEAEIDYSVDKAYRNKGYGKKMLRLLIDEVTRKHCRIRRLTAKVKPDNAASRAVFIANGFKEMPENTYILNIDRT